MGSERQRELDVTSALEGLDVIEAEQLDSLSADGLAALVTARAVLRRQCLLLGACVGALRALANGQPTVLRLLASIDDVAPRRAQVQNIPEGCTVPDRPVPGPDRDARGDLVK